MAKDAKDVFTVKNTKIPNFTVSVSNSKRDPNVRIITFGGFTEADAKQMYALMYLGGRPREGIKQAQVKGNLLQVKVPNDKIDTFINTRLKNIMGALKRNNYEEYAVNTIIDKLDYELHKPGDEEKKKAAAESYDDMADMWMTYLNNLGNPLFVEAYNIYAKIYANRQWGHMLSFRNILMIQNAAKKDGRHPTLVLGATVWNKYGRGVKRGAKPYYLERLNTDGKTYDGEEYNQAKDACGFPDMNIKELSFTVDHLLNVTAENIHYRKTHNQNIYSSYWGYDIADTYPFPGYPSTEDFLNAKPGALSNIANDINQLAKEIEEKEGKKKDELPDAYNANDMEERTRVAADYILQACQKSKITVAPANNPTQQLINGLKAYYRRITPKAANVIKENNIESYVNDSVHMTLMILNIGLDGVNQFQHTMTYTKKEAAALSPIFFKVINALGAVIYPANGVPQIDDSQPANAAAATVNEGQGNDAMELFIKGIEMIGGKVVDDKEDSAMNLSESVSNFLKSYNNTLYKINGGYLDGE